MRSQIRGRILGSGEQDLEIGALYALLAAMVRQAYRDIEQVKRLGEQARAHEVTRRREAEQFLEECRQTFADRHKQPASY